MSFPSPASDYYRHAMEKLIDKLKSDFESEVASNLDALYGENLKDDLKTHTQQTHIFDSAKLKKSDWERS